MKEFPRKDPYMILGYSANAMCAEITLEFSECGTEDFARREEEVCCFLEELHKEDILAEELFSLRFRVTTGRIPYASRVNGFVQGGIAPAIFLSTCMHPVHHKDTNPANWSKLVEMYAQKLGERFRRPNLKVTYSGEAVKIYQGRIRFDEVA